ncbi:hypothetical protein CU097_002749, partial [Rhizopus azygosporus]
FSTQSREHTSTISKHIEQLFESVSPAPIASSSSSMHNVAVQGNYYNINHDGSNEEDVENVAFHKKWVDFLADAENNNIFHRY